MRFKLHGFRELDRALAELPKAVGKAVLRRAAEKALEPMRAAAEALAPRDRGDLQMSIAVSEKRTRRVRRKRGLASGVVVAMGPKAGNGVLDYATFDEFGTQDTAAKPFMRPSFDAHAPGAIADLGEQLGNEIAKAAKRLAKRRARVS